MTLEINKSLSEQMLRIQWDYYPEETENQTMILYNEFEKEVATLSLGTNYSQIKYRYGKYLITKSQLDALGDKLKEGLYLYKVRNESSSPDCNCCNLAVGSLKVVVNCCDETKIAESPIEYEDANDDTGYITYNG